MSERDAIVAFLRGKADEAADKGVRAGFEFHSFYSAMAAALSSAANSVKNGEHMKGSDDERL